MVTLSFVWTQIKNWLIVLLEKKKSFQNVPYLRILFQPPGASGLGPLSRVFFLLAFVNLFQRSELLLFNLAQDANILVNSADKFQQMQLSFFTTMYNFKIDR